MTNDVPEYVEKRKQMVEYQLIPRDIHDPATLESMAAVPRHCFVPSKLHHYAYEDGPLEIGYGQTISQPYIVALMTQAAEVESSSHVLEIGTGSGYAAAILSLIVQEVYTVERIPQLATQAQERFAQLGYDNIHVKVANGTLGWPEKAPFDAIIVTAGAPVIPESLLEQLKPAGRMVIPVGDAFSQELVRIRKSLTGKDHHEFLGPVRFVPLIGEEGWEE
ncbi:MAG: protein-L-isoaspartate(D-aspartate) O-methyltransferase [Waddliaceae bacterium]